MSASKGHRIHRGGARERKRDRQTNKQTDAYRQQDHAGIKTKIFNRFQNVHTHTCEMEGTQELKHTMVA